MKLPKNNLKKIKFPKFKKLKISSDNKFILFLKSRLLKLIFVWLIGFLAVAEVVFAIMIYGFKMENKAVRYASYAVPFPVAVANQDFVTNKAYLSEKDYIHHFYQATGQTDLDFTSIDQEILNQLIENKIIGFQALRYKVKVSKSDVDNSVNQIVDQNGGSDKVNQALNELYGLTLNQFKDLVRTQLLREKVSNELIMKVSARHILILVDKDAAQDKVDAAKTKIDGIKNEIDGGLDFAEAAKKYSEDVGSADQGGKLDPFARGEMVKEFSDTAFNTPVGTVSDPVRTEFGWHIIKVESKTGKIDKSFNDWLDGLKNKSLILKLI